MAEMNSSENPATQKRIERAFNSRDFDVIRTKRLVETVVEDLMEVMRPRVKVVKSIEMGDETPRKRIPRSTVHYLKRLHNCALRKGWLLCPVLQAGDWPKLELKPKRAITWDEHMKIVSDDENEERRLYYEILWEIGASQSDAAELTAENIDWKNGILFYRRKKLRSKNAPPARLVIGPRLKGILEQLPSRGPLFPRICNIPNNHRAAEFRRRCLKLEILEISLHSYRYAWAERALEAGYPERWAQAALGHASKAIHHSYAKNAAVTCPSLEEYSEKIVQLSKAG